MAENESDSCSSDTITREALGRIARLGDLYDATTDKFCAISMFREHIPPDSPAVTRTDNHHCKISTTITSSLKEKFDILNIKADLKLSILAGQVDLRGSAEYLDDKKTSFKSVECALVCSTTTVVEQLDLFNEDVKTRISHDALRHPRATHVVLQIYWGADCTVKVIDQNSENKKKKTVEGNLKAQVDKLKMIAGSAETDAEAAFTEKEKENWTKLSLEIFGDILSDSSGKFPTTLDGAMELLRNLPQLIQTSNDRKGKPVAYVLFPLSSPAFLNYVSQSKIRSLRQVDEGLIVQVIQSFDYLSELTQKARDRWDEINDHSIFVTASELKELHSILRSLEVQEATVRSDLQKRLERVRSGDNEFESLAAFAKQHHETADSTFQKFEKIHNSILCRIQFGKRCKKYGATYLTTPVREQIASACDDYENVYVLFDGEVDDETTERNRSTFIELARNKQNDSTTIFYVTLFKQGQDATIKYYREGKLILTDVVKELEIKDTAISDLSARPTFGPFEARCPGSFDGHCSREKRSWTCSRCNQTLQFCSSNCSLYCSCGISKVMHFRFRCRDEAHGSHFTPWREEILPSFTRMDIKGEYSWNYMGPTPTRTSSPNSGRGSSRRVRRLPRSACHRARTWNPADLSDARTFPGEDRRDDVR